MQTQIDSTSSFFGTLFQALVITCVSWAPIGKPHSKILSMVPCFPEEISCESETIRDQPPDLLRDQVQVLDRGVLQSAKLRPATPRALTSSQGTCPCLKSSTAAALYSSP